MFINENRLWTRLHELGKIGQDETGAVTRLPFTSVEMKAKNWILHEMKEVGLDVHEDHVGNIIGIYNPTKSKKAPVLSGSHYDTVRSGGIFDGTLGLLGAIEVAQTMKENNVQCERPFYVIGYKDEEGNRFNSGMIGSKTVTGKAKKEDFDPVDDEGISIFEAMKEAGYTPERFQESKIDPIYASVELHIEQGKVLEQNHCSIGIVEGIPYLRYYEITIRGCSGHAGATPMKNRQDPVVAMAKWIQQMTMVASSYPYTVATIGKITTVPGSPNVICDHVSFTLDIRSIKEENIEACLKEMEDLNQALQEVGYSISYRLLHVLEGVVCDEQIKQKMENLISKRHYSFMRFMSGAGHDSQNFKDVCPCSMIFVKSSNGYSHRKEEYTPKEDCAKGANILLDVVTMLCNE